MWRVLSIRVSMKLRTLPAAETAFLLSSRILSRAAANTTQNQQISITNKQLL